MASPSPYSALPAGWYCVAFSHELAVGQVLALRYFERELVLFRTATGGAVLADAHCPHLGAHLGHGGEVEGELLRCPFHGFCFGTDGRCRSTPYGYRPPPAARLRLWPLREMHGLVLTWFDPGGGEPGWQVPDHEVRGWSPLAGGRLALRSHPQETSENSVDFGHFSELHGFVDAEVRRAAELEGPLLRASYAMRRRLPGLGRRGVRLEFDVEVHGLGYSLVEARLPGLGIEMRHWVLSTPIDPEHVHLRLASRVRRLAVPGLATLAARLVFHLLRREVLQDRRVWEHKAYLARPVLAAGDGPIGAYRRWCRQFYGQPAAAVGSGSVRPLAEKIAPGGARATGEEGPAAAQRG